MKVSRADDMPVYMFIHISMLQVSRADDMPVYMRRRLEQFEFITEDDPYNPEVITEAEAPQVTVAYVDNLNAVGKN